MSGSFINDGDYTQHVEGRRGEGGMAFYHGLHRELDMTPSEKLGGKKFPFRGGDRKMPVTEKVLRCQYEVDDVQQRKVKRKGDECWVTELDESDNYVEDSFLVFAGDEDVSGGSQSVIKLDESSELFLENDDSFQ